MEQHFRGKQRAMLPIVDRAALANLLAEVAGAVAGHSPSGWGPAGGLRGVSRYTGVPVATLSNWVNERAAYMSRKAFQQLTIGLPECLLGDGDAYHKAFCTLAACVAEPADGFGFYPIGRIAVRSRESLSTLVRELAIDAGGVRALARSTSLRLATLSDWTSTVGAVPRMTVEQHGLLQRAIRNSCATWPRGRAHTLQAALNTLLDEAAEHVTADTKRSQRSKSDWESQLADPVFLEDEIGTGGYEMILAGGLPAENSSAWRRWPRMRWCFVSPAFYRRMQARFRGPFAVSGSLDAPPIEATLGGEMIRVMFTHAPVPKTRGRRLPASAPIR